jgi:hypothetical protein
MITVYNFCKDISEYRTYWYARLIGCCTFHDFDHSMGKEKDNINVQRAIEAFSDTMVN